jgi:hypothetical protein
MTLAASVMKLASSVFETKGKVREARRLHSMTFTAFALASSWMLKGPEMARAAAIWAAMVFT